jgi:hypothetical protein
MWVRSRRAASASFPAIQGGGGQIVFPAAAPRGPAMPVPTSANATPVTLRPPVAGERRAIRRPRASAPRRRFLGQTWSLRSGCRTARLHAPQPHCSSVRGSCLYGLNLKLGRSARGRSGLCSAVVQVQMTRSAPDCSSDATTPSRAAAADRNRVRRIAPYQRRGDRRRRVG